jgi:RNA polymerase sigma factor (sigma-70 family)
VIEDACQFAWSRLVHHRKRVHRESALGWLVTTAVHEAFKLTRRERRDVSLELALETQLAPTRQVPSLDDQLERRDRLEAVGALPRRQQRLLWLHAVGLSYREIAAHESCTVRTVERQLLRARRTLRDEAAAGEPLPRPAALASSPLRRAELARLDRSL